MMKITNNGCSNNNKPTCHETNNEADNPDRVGGKIQFADLSDQ